MSLSHQLTDDTATLLFTMDDKTAHVPAAPCHAPPPLPQRNSRRSSRFLNALHNASAPTPAADTPMPVSAAAAVAAATTAAPDTPKAIAEASAHEIYLSSEEDASSFGDVSDCDDSEYDGSDFDADYDSDTVEYGSAAPILRVVTASPSSSAAFSGPASAPLTSALPSAMAERETTTVRRHSHGDKARVVSVIFSGKPALVDLAVERAERRQSINDRTTSPTPSTRPSTSASSAPSTAFSSVNATPPRSLHHKRNSSGSMVASFRARKAMEIIPDARAYDAAASESDIPKLSRRSYTASLALPLMREDMAAPLSVPATPTTATAAPRAVSGGHSNLLRGVTRTLTLRRRSSNLGIGASASTSASASAADAPASPLLRPSSTMGAMPAAFNSRRRSMVLSAASLGLGGGDRKVPPLPQTPEEYAFPSSIAEGLCQSAPSTPKPPARHILSKKSDQPSSSVRFFGRRRSVRMP